MRSSLDKSNLITGDDFKSNDSVNLPASMSLSSVPSLLIILQIAGSGVNGVIGLLVGDEMIVEKLIILFRNGIGSDIFTQLSRFIHSLGRRDTCLYSIGSSEG